MAVAWAGGTQTVLWDQAGLAGSARRVYMVNGGCTDTVAEGAWRGDRR